MADDPVRPRARRKDVFPRPSDWRLAELAVGLFFGAYVVARIFLLDLTNDELGALEDVYQKGFLSLLSFEYVDAQNHFLTGVLSIAALRILPFDEVVSIRLPSLLGFAFYLYGAGRISRLLASKPLGFLLFVALLANAFVLDFFSLSRGYALAPGFLLLSLAALLEWILRGEEAGASSGRSQKALIFAGLAVLAHLAFLNYFLAVFCVLLYPAIRELEHVRWRERGVFSELGAIILKHSYLVYGALILIAFYTDRIILMMGKDGFYFGGKNGFIADTVKSLVSSTLYGLEVTPGVLWALTWLVVAAFWAMAISALRWARARPTFDPSKGAALIAVLVLVMVTYALGAYSYFGIRYVIERAAIMFVPLFLVLVGFWAAAAGERWARLAMGFLLLYAVLGFSQMNLTHTYTWPINADIREFVRDLGEINDKASALVPVAITNDCKSTTWYYITQLLGLDVKEELKNNYFRRDFDKLAVFSPTHGRPPNYRTFVHPTAYYFMTPEDYATSPPPFAYEVFKTYPTSGCVLLRRTGP